MKATKSAELTFSEDYSSPYFDNAPIIVKGSIIKKEGNGWRVYSPDGKKYGVTFHSLEGLPISENQSKEDRQEAGIEQVKLENELMKGTLYSIIHDAYPTDIFPPITSEQWKEIHQCIYNRLGIPIDRLSAEYGRLLRKPLIEEAQDCLKKLNSNNPDKEQQKKLITEIMQEDEKDGLYDNNPDIDLKK